MPSRIYWDTNCFLAWFQQEPARIDALKPILRDAQNAEVVIVTSALTITECAGLPGVRPVDDDASNKMVAFLESPFIALRPVDRAVAQRAHDLVRLHAIKHKDAIHLATAVLAKVEVFHTYDAAKGKQHGLLTHNRAPWLDHLRIERPPDPVKGTVFDPTNKQ